MEQQIQLNDHNKQEYPPMHTYDSNTSLIKVLKIKTLSLMLKIYK